MRRANAFLVPTKVRDIITNWDFLEVVVILPYPAMNSDLTVVKVGSVVSIFRIVNSRGSLNLPALEDSTLRGHHNCIVDKKPVEVVPSHLQGRPIKLVVLPCWWGISIKASIRVKGGQVLFHLLLLLGGRVENEFKKLLIAS